MKIGVIDSGIGGITTLKVLTENIKADYYYYLDNGNIPYGDKSEDKLYEIARCIVGKICKLGVDMIVIACNTLSATVGDRLRAEIPIPIVLIEPNIKEAYNTHEPTLLVATNRTIGSSKFARLVSRYQGVDIVSSSTLATYIEKGMMKNAKCEIFSYLTGKNYKNIVLGCTHYVYLKDYLEDIGYNVFEGNVGVMKETRRIVKKLEKDGKITPSNESQIYLHMGKGRDVQCITKYLSKKVMFW